MPNDLNVDREVQLRPGTVGGQGAQTLGPGKAQSGPVAEGQPSVSADGPEAGGLLRIIGREGDDLEAEALEIIAYGIHVT